jgi:hypothetical protein
MLRSSQSTLLLALAVTAVVPAGCSTDLGPTQAQPRVAQDVPADATPVQQGGVETVVTVADQAIRAPRRQVVDTQAAWEAVWAESSANVLPPSPAPTVDLSDHVLVVLAMGGRPTGGYAISADALSQRGADLWLTVVERSPGPGCMVTQATTAPLTVVLVPRTGGQLYLVERKATTECG